jgi:serine/threonine-protein kinase
MLPNHFADSRAAWTGIIPGLELPGRIEAAAFRGKPVSFQILEPWKKPERTVPEAPLQIKLLFVFFITIVFAAAYLARKNLRRGRGDRRGAARIALFTFVLGAISWVVNEHHVTTQWEFSLFMAALPTALFSTFVIWAVYIALEPDVRRLHSSILISWTRALAGDWRDPRLGRDVLVGCAVGIGYLCFMQFLTVAPGWLGYAEGPLAERDVGFLFATNISAGHLIEQPVYALADGLGIVLLYAYLKLLFRSTKITAVIWVLIVSAVILGISEAPLIFLPLVIAGAAALLAVILRFGLVSITVAPMTGGLWIAPITLRTSTWYSGIGYVALLATAAIAFYGFRTSLGGRRLLSPEANEQNISAY